MSIPKLQRKYYEVYRECSPQIIKDIGWPRNRNEAFVMFARPGGSLLEIGCGEGSVLHYIYPVFDRVYGVELSSIRVARAKELLLPYTNCHVLNQSLEQFTKTAPEDLEFDCILWADVIEHVVDVLAAFQAVAKLAAPGAQLLTSTPNIAFILHRLKLFFGKFTSTALPTHPDEGFMRPAEKNYPVGFRPSPLLYL